MSPLDIEDQDITISASTMKHELEAVDKLNKMLDSLDLRPLGLSQFSIDFVDCDELDGNTIGSLRYSIENVLDIIKDGKDKRFFEMMNCALDVFFTPNDNDQAHQSPASDGSE